ncbi:hypothetical protein [Alloactinosynnema sp. L-07]|uniref:hypothetical protein n=1 Tax=Alloactinosynnema sp. L-07 TaxID=1653480 RepID=UPI00065EFFD3|nr:hypothetical protein [Alloactinosynnema sp. L-07]CRK56199.1 hypothetical protein [Alloactinosynnema sp. L-07]
MSTLVRHANEISPDLFGDLDAQTGARSLSGMTPVMATPTAVALGIAISAVAFHAGYMYGIARNMAEGSVVLPQ